MLRKLEVLKQHARVQMSLLKNECDMYRRTLNDVREKLNLANDFYQKITARRFFFFFLLFFFLTKQQEREKKEEGKASFFYFQLN